jgi:hypothetical protein
VTDSASSAEVPAAVPLPLRDGPYEAVRAAWAAGCRAHVAHSLPLEGALERLARGARTEGVSVIAVLRTLDVISRSSDGDGGTLDRGDVRAWAGGVVIRAYFRDD